MSMMCLMIVHVAIVKSAFKQTKVFSNKAWRCHFYIVDFMSIRQSADSTGSAFRQLAGQSGKDGKHTKTCGKNVFPIEIEYFYGCCFTSTLVYPV